MISINKLIDQFYYHANAPVLFNTAFFLFFLLFTLICSVTLSRWNTLRITALTILSLYFYYKSCGYYLIFILLSAIVDYNIANIIYLTERKLTRGLLLFLSLVINLGLLVYFKYTNMLIEAYNTIGTSHVDYLKIMLPVGISFYTFENISYTIDVYRKHIKPVNSFGKYLFFLSFFPKLIAGPIVRAADFIPQITQQFNLTKEKYGRALFLIAGGLIKKCILSDYISINFVDRVFDNPLLYTSAENLLAVYGYTLQIYCDFSGYSDIAIGIALWLGFTIPDNFNLPYQAADITDFWRRWHISLSSWLRDYLYISFGGNRCAKWRQQINLFLTMLIGGLWHGASIKFVIWGAIHGLGLIVHKYVALFTSKKSFTSKKIYTLIATIITFHFVAFAWIFFRANNLTTVQQMINKLFDNYQWQHFVYFIMGYKLVFVLMFIGYLLHFVRINVYSKLESYFNRAPLVVHILVLLSVILMVTQFKTAALQPFIYFQF